jgi:hypothetical protein
MSERLLPEAIRGSWYLLPEEGSPAEALDDKGQLLALRLDGTFTRYTADATSKEVKEEGDYTFDGDFLILRARNTDTFRVHIKEDWYWFLEAKKKSRRLYRGLIDEGDFVELDAESRREIDMLPMRVSVQCPYDDEEGAVFDLVYQPKEGDKQRIGCFSVDPDPETGALWVGLTALATNLKVETWEKVLRKSYLGMHRGGEEFGWVALELFGPEGATHEFNAAG